MPAERRIRMPFGEIAMIDTGGAGLPLLMLHGSGAAKEVFAAQIESPIAALHRIIAIDLPGHGTSSAAIEDDISYTLPALANTAAAVLRELGIARTAVYGWSLGGHIAIEMMHLHPELLAGVMVSGAPPIARGALGMLRGFHARWDMLLASKPHFSQAEAERFARLCYGDATTDELVRDVMRADGRVRAVFSRSMSRGDGADQKRVVETSKIPFAMINGANEPIVRLSYVAALAYANLWEGHAQTIPNAAHAPFLQAPHAFNAVLHRFMTDMALKERVNELAPELDEAAPVRTGRVRVA